MFEVNNKDVIDIVLVPLLLTLYSLYVCKSRSNYDFHPKYNFVNYGHTSEGDKGQKAY